MRLSSVAAILVTLSSTRLVLADHMTTWTGASNSSGRWFSAFGQHDIPAAKGGCQNLNDRVPGLVELCIDYGRHRAHFYFSGQGKRCLQEVSSTPYNCNGGCRERDRRTRRSRHLI
ncbi:hypothetical protein DFP72DRAFT_1023583 [Ephemerocybe angulata]|uniref:WSC domain-containing protein n=1 Tax=Ephemerocybe angulata TaxID=980116 RepID=A0A8H6H7J4_9AGAR|nr:hypothetical protein DFP72DRAFT_1023583 [Tulosesus angulatus]